ncbi:MAG: putative peptidoglycan glycosyltransferase FtsW [Bryobacteraceae bacterium]
MSQRLKTDWILFFTVLAMVSFGAVMIYSSSSIMARLDPRIQSSWHFVIRQLEFAVLGVVAMMLLKKTDYHLLRSPGVAFGAIGVAMVLLFGVYFLDPDHHRWLRLGPVGLQPSELAKPALVVFLAFFVTWRGRAINNARYTLVPAACAVGLVIGAVVRPDLGTAVVLGFTAAAVFFVAGLEFRYCLIAALIALFGFAASIAAEPYRLIRVVKHYDPELKLISRIDPHGRIRERMEETLRTHDPNYQQDQSKIAVGAGGPLGVGLMNGRQKLLYLPEAHTDFIYAVIGEEAGLIGTVGLLGCFLVIGGRGLRVAVLARDEFGRYLALGGAVVLVVQAFINMSVAVGLGPTKGIPLPLISYGGSSLVSSLAMLGMLMNVAEHVG